MPSTYSPKLRLELMATGENRSTWGNKANNGFNLIEQAIAGFVSIDMADANITLTAVNAATDQSRMGMVEVTGALTAIRSITIPTVSHNYIIRNATTGGFAVTVTNGTNSVTVPAATWNPVWTDGTNVYTSPPLNFTSIQGTASAAQISGNYPNITGVGALTSGSINDAVHGTRAGGTLHAEATTSVAGFMSAADKVKIDQLVPPGTYIEFAGTTAPTGYLIANGAAVSRTTYAALFAVCSTNYGAGDGSTTFNLPDRRGQFARGLDLGRGLDPGRAAYSSQTSQNLSHSHTITVAAAGSHAHSGTTSADSHSHTGTTSASGDHVHAFDSANAGNGSGGGGSYTGAATIRNTYGAGNHSHSFTTSTDTHSHTYTTSTVANHTHTASETASGGTEARPTNLAVLICIKY